MARLRELFGDPLLIRTNKGMELTRRAEELVAPLQAWLAHTDSLFVHRVFDPATVDRRFKVASTDFGVTSVIAPALSRFHREAPAATFDVVPFTDSMFAKLTSGEIDLIISGMDPDNSVIYSQRLFAMVATCVMRADHPLASETEGQLSIDQFLAWPHISILVGESGYDRIASLLGERASERKVIATVPYFQAAHAMLAASDALVLLPQPGVQQLVDREQFAIRKAPGIFAPMDYWILWHERSRRDPATMWLIDIISESCASHNAPLPEAVPQMPGSTTHST